MAAEDANILAHQGHIAMFVVDEVRDLVRFSCKFCGATCEPMKLGEPTPPDFRGLPHVPRCIVIAHAIFLDRRAA